MKKMNEIFMKAAAWLRESNRWKHLLGGAAIGLCANDLYCAAYAGAGVGAALELKDRLWGGKWDWADLALTAAGALAGYGLRAALSGQARVW